MKRKRHRPEGWFNVFFGDASSDERNVRACPRRGIMGKRRRNTLVSEPGTDILPRLGAVLPLRSGETGRRDDELYGSI
jgi:hypothetical protein